MLLFQHCILDLIESDIILELHSRLERKLPRGSGLMRFCLFLLES